jgi:hypothetical protein
MASYFQEDRDGGPDGAEAAPFLPARESAACHEPPAGSAETGPNPALTSRSSSPGHCLKSRLMLFYF